MAPEESDTIVSVDRAAVHVGKLEPLTGAKTALVGFVDTNEPDILRMTFPSVRTRPE